MGDLKIGIVTDSHSGRFDKKIVKALKKAGALLAETLSEIPQLVKKALK